MTYEVTARQMESWSSLHAHTMNAWHTQHQQGGWTGGNKTGHDTMAQIIHLRLSETWRCLAISSCNGNTHTHTHIHTYSW